MRFGTDPSDGLSRHRESVAGKSFAELGTPRAKASPRRDDLAVEVFDQSTSTRIRMNRWVEVPESIVWVSLTTTSRVPSGLSVSLTSAAPLS